MTEHAKVIEYKGKKIVYTKVKDESMESFKAALDAENHLVMQMEGDGLILNNVSELGLNAKKILEAQKSVVKIVPKLKKNAVVGIPKVFLNLANTFSILTDANFKVFETEEEAKDWLVE